MNESWIGNASGLEIVWTLVALFGVLFNAQGIGQAYGDLRFLLGPHVPARGWLLAHAARRSVTAPTAREILALGQLRRECVNTLVQTAFLVAGITAMFTPPPIVVQVQLQTIINIALFVIAELAIAWCSMQDRIERRWMINLYRQERRARRASDRSGH